MSDWTDLDEAYLEIFGDHPNMSARPTATSVSIRTGPESKLGDRSPVRMPDEAT